MAAYATPADMILRYSPATLGDLVSDDGDRVTGTDLTTNAKLLMALDTATGKIRAAVMQANRYNQDDLDEVMALANESTEYLIDITCRIAWWVLWRRKPWQDQYDRMLQNVKAEYDEILDMLRKGVEIFDLDAKRLSGNPKGAEAFSSSPPTERMWSSVPRGRYYPNCRKRSDSYDT